MHWAQVDQRRLHGYAGAMDSAGLSERVTHIVSVVTMPGAYASAVDVLGDARGRPTAIVATCDEVAIGAIIMWTVLEGLRFLELPLSETKIAALRFIILGVVLIGLMAFRPQGAFGKREEMVLGD